MMSLTAWVQARRQLDDHIERCVGDKSEGTCVLVGLHRLAACPEGWRLHRLVEGIDWSEGDD